MQTIMVIGSGALASAVLEKLLEAIGRPDLGAWLKLVTIALMSTLALKLIVELLAILNGFL